MYVYTEYYYKVDGGNVPDHHQPHNIIIQQSESGFKIGLNTIPYPSLELAEKGLTKKYDRIVLQSTKTVYIQDVNRVIKWENKINK